MECDRTTKDRWTEYQEQPQPPKEKHELENKPWRLYSNVPINPAGKQEHDLGRKISTDLSHSIDLSLFSPPLLARWKKIDTLNNTSLNLVDWYTLHFAATKAPRPRQRWETRLSSRQLPTGSVMANIGTRTTLECPRGCGHPEEDSDHIFQCNKGDNTWDKLQKSS